MDSTVRYLGVALNNALSLSEATPHQTPAPSLIDMTPWRAMSLLQKAIRRGHSGFALQAAASLLHLDPDRFWRRAGIIAFEDFGVTGLNIVGIVTAAIEGKRVRQSRT